ncbi:membrane fusion protein (multidrug efflux system) [Elusimicrobium posterum]|uniref:efflux RND transporter periplasmic adaptor subunit n=1 Tax=Elusimicrobium posterum TaxID=3116653 RepID=UPI003C75C7A7
MKKTACCMLLVLFVLVLTNITGCKNKQAATGQETEAPVTAVKVLKMDLPWNIEYPAQVAGSLEIMIRAQVGGILQSRLYNEGDFVEKGTQLFQIDDKEYVVALQKARGALAQAEAELKRTERDYARMKKLRKDHATSQKDYDNSLSAYEAAQANLMVAKADVSNAEINLGYTKVTAPISGIAREEAQSVGSLISPAGDTGLLTTMVQIDPLYVNFSMPSTQFEKLTSGFVAGEIALGDGKVTLKEINDSGGREKISRDNAPLYVEAILPNGKTYSEKGKLIFFDSTENTQTASLAVKAQFPNPQTKNGLLMPGQFVRVRLVGAVYRDAVLIPSSAVLSTPSGIMVYVINEENTIKAVPIKAELQDDVYMVSEGLSGGERIVNTGLIKIRPDQKVKPDMQDFKIENIFSSPKETADTGAPQQDCKPASAQK